MRFGGRRGAGPRLGALLLLAAFAASPARAMQELSPPFHYEPDVTRERNAFLVENALRACWRDAADSGSFELIEIEFAYDTRTPFTPTIKSKRSSLGRPLYWCVERELAKLRLRPVPGHPGPYTQFYALGEIPPLPKEFLPAWQRAVPDPALVRRALSAWLQPEVEVTAAGCLHVLGPPILAEQFLDWRPAPGSDQSFALHNGDRLSPLPDDWWLRRRTRYPNTDSDAPGAYKLVDEEFCLEHVDPAVSALLRGDVRLNNAVNRMASFDAEWVVDGQGRLDGDIGLCLAPQLSAFHPNPYTPREADQLRRQVEDLLSGLDYGHANGSRRIRIRYDDAHGVIVRGVAPADRPLDRAASAVETKCDRRAALECARNDEESQPSFASVAPLRKCLGDSGANDEMISATFDITPDGAVANLRLDATDGNTTRIPGCLRETIPRLAFPRSDGGSCRQTMRTHDLLRP